MKAYIGTYAKYNNGSIAGAWLDLTDYSDHEEFMLAARDLHKDESDPELMIQDWEGSNKLISEHGVNPLTWEVLELSEHEQKIVEHLMENGSSAEQAIEKQEDVIVLHCEFEHEAHEAYWEHISESMDLENLPFCESYIDKEAMYKRDGNTFYFVSGLGLVNTD